MEFLKVDFQSEGWTKAGDAHCNLPKVQNVNQTISALMKNS